jgi:hypothetical protein
MGSMLPLPLGDDVGEADIRAAQRWGEGKFPLRPTTQHQ